MCIHHLLFSVFSEFQAPPIGWNMNYRVSSHLKWIHLDANDAEEDGGKKACSGTCGRCLKQQQICHQSDTTSTKPLIVLVFCLMLRLVVTSPSAQTRSVLKQLTSDSQGSVKLKPENKRN